MKSLQICNKLPFPNIDGGTMGFHHLTELLSTDSGDELHVIAVNSEKQKGSLEQVPAAYIQKHQAQYPYLDLSIKPWKAFLNLFSRHSLNMIRFDQPHVHDLIAAQLKKQKYDVVFIETLYMMPFFDTIKKHHQGKIIYRSHNVEYQIWESLAANEKQPIKKWYLNVLAKRLKAYEIQRSFLSDGFTSVSLSDIAFYHHYKADYPALYLPYSFDHFIPMKACSAKVPMSFYFIGGMDWEPNIRAVKFIVDEIVPRLQAANFSGTIYIGGRRMPIEWQSRLGDIVQFVGEIDDLALFLSQQHVLISPLFTGGGLKIKIVEAFAKGIHVITNLESLNSLPASPDDIAFVANDAEQFANAILAVSAQPSLFADKEKHIQKMLNDYFLFENNKQKLKTFIETL